MADPLVDLWHLPLSTEEKNQLAFKIGMLRDPFSSAPTPEHKASILRAFLRDSAPVNHVDLTFKTISEFSTPVVPALEDVASFLVTKAPGLKILVSKRAYERVREYDIQGLFEASDSDRCFALEDHLLGCVLPVPDTGNSEFSYIQTWDNVINTPVKLFMNVPFKKDRNTNFNTGTDAFLPDLVGYIGASYSLWLAEEKPEGTGDPLQELVSKRKWCYKNLPYILGYFARGLSVTLVTLYNLDGIVKSSCIASFDLQKVGDRIKLFMVMLNVGRVLAGLHDICVSNNEGTEFEDVKTIVSGKSVKLAGDMVIKGYPTMAKRMEVWKIYSALKGCPNMESCLSRSPKNGDPREGEKRKKVEEFTLRFSPRLSRHARATTQAMLVKALLDVIKALSWLHLNRWIHRDLRWPNVLQNGATEVWTLIDADEACSFEQAASKAHPLCEHNHAPEMLAGPHDSSVDVWGLGHLIRTAKNAVVDDTLWLLAHQCLEADPKRRPLLSQCRDTLTSCARLLK